MVLDVFLLLLEDAFEFSDGGLIECAFVPLLLNLLPEQVELFLVFGLSPGELVQKVYFLIEHSL